MNRRDIIKGLAFTSILFSLNSKEALTLLSLNHSDELINDNTFSIFKKIIKYAKNDNWNKLDINKIIIKIANFFINSPYKAGTLEGSKELCRIDFTGFDCVTLMENSLDLARIIKKQKYTMEDLINEITYTRYRNGKLTDYTSRLHYTADWIYDNIKKNVIVDRTQEIGGIPIMFNLSFMSKNYEYYSSLQNNTQLIEVIEGIEKEINTRTYYYIPKAQVEKAEDYLNSGDIVAFVTNKIGLDYSHIGLVIKLKGEARLLHASSKKKKVIVDVSLHKYIENISSNLGISILSPLNPM